MKVNNDLVIVICNHSTVPNATLSCSTTTTTTNTTTATSIRGPSLLPCSLFSLRSRHEPGWHVKKEMCLRLFVLLTLCLLLPKMATANKILNRLEVEKTMMRFLPFPSFLAPPPAFTYWPFPAQQPSDRR